MQLVFHAGREAAGASGDRERGEAFVEPGQLHPHGLGALFGQVLMLCEQAGLAKLGHVALDGTKIRANASKHKAMSYGRMKLREAELAAEVQKWLEQAAATDAAEDEALCQKRRGDELPDWVKSKQTRAAAHRR